MVKRTIFYTLMVFLIAALVYIDFQHNRPAEAVVTIDPIDYTISPQYNVDSIDPYITSSPDTVKVLFYRSDDPSSVYLFNTILNQILADYGLESFDDLVYCDLTGYTPASANETRNRWGFYEIPALAAIRYSNGNYDFVSVLQWGEGGLTRVDVENWLKVNGVLAE